MEPTVPYLQEEAPSNGVVLNEGGVPPQPHVPDGLDEQDMFLYTAWAHNLDPSKPVTDYSIFLFIQTHVSVKTIETLEQYLAKSFYWSQTKSGMYLLTDDGCQLLNRFGEPPEPVDIGRTYQFSTEVNGNHYQINHDSHGRKKVFLNDRQVTASQVYRKLRMEKVPIQATSSWTPDLVFDWIIYSMEYTWRRI